MPLTLPNNEHLFKKLTAYEQQEYVALGKEAAKLSQEQPELDTAIYTRYMHDFLEAGAKHRATLDAHVARSQAAGVVPDQKWMDAESVRMRNEFVAEFMQKTLPQYGEKGKEAWTKLGKKMTPKTIPGMLLSPFYDEDKGGMRWGGLIGGLLGGLFVFNKLGGMAGGMLGIIGTVIAAIAGAWLVNKGTDTLSDFFSSKKGPEQAQAPAQAAGKTVPGKTAPAANVSKPAPAIDPLGVKKPDLGEIVPNIVITGGSNVSDDNILNPATTPINRGNPMTKKPGVASQPQGKQ